MSGGSGGGDWDVGALADIGGLSDADIAGIAAVPEAIVSAWRAGLGAPMVRDQRVLADLTAIVCRLGAYYAPGEVRDWLSAAHAQLGGQRALDLIGAGRLDEVRRVLTRLDADAFL